jgi:hypothetical protein
MLKRMARRLSGELQPPVSGTRYLLAFFSGLLLLAAGFAALGLSLALGGYQRFTHKTQVAEVQCVELDRGKLRLYLVPIEPDGLRGATETYDLSGDEWTVGGDVLRFRPLVTALGVSTVFRLSRVEGRWSTAADANQHRATAYDRHPPGALGTPAWLALYRSGARGPLGWLVAGAHGQAVSQLPDRLAVYNLYVSAGGFILEKKTF